jgi:hypothetical protein
MNSIIDKSEKDKVELTNILMHIQNGYNEGGILVNLRNDVTRLEKNIENAKEHKKNTSAIEKQLADVNKAIATAESTGRFSGDAPIYTFQKPVFGLQKVSVDDPSSYSYNNDDNKNPLSKYNPKQSNTSSKTNDYSHEDTSDYASSKNGESSSDYKTQQEEGKGNGQNSSQKPASGNTQSGREPASSESKSEDQDTRSDKQRAGKTSRSDRANEEGTDGKLSRNSDGKLVSGSDESISEEDSAKNKDRSQVIIDAEEALDKLFDRETELVGDIVANLGLSVEDINGKSLTNRLSFIKKAITAQKKNKLQQLAVDTIAKLSKLAEMQQNTSMSSKEVSANKKAIKDEASDERQKILSTAKTTKAKIDNIKANKETQEVNKQQKLINALRDKLLADYVSVSVVDGKRVYKLLDGLSKENETKAIGYLNRLNRIINPEAIGNIFVAPKARRKSNKPEIAVGGSEDNPSAGSQTYNESNSFKRTTYDPDAYTHDADSNPYNHDIIDPELMAEADAAFDGTPVDSNPHVEDSVDFEATDDGDGSMEQYKEENNQTPSTPKTNIFSFVGESKSESEIKRLNDIISKAHDELKATEKHYIYVALTEEGKVGRFDKKDLTDSQRTDLINEAKKKFKDELRGCQL